MLDKIHKHCFFPGQARDCTNSCAAYIEDGKTNCRILNIVEKLIPASPRPTAPTPPKVSK